jgi:signal transduction histidine kinase
MPEIRLKFGLILYGAGLMVVTLMTVFFPSSAIAPPGFGYRLTDSFERVSLNNRVQVASAFRWVPGEPVNALQKRIRQSFKPNRYVYGVIHGHSSAVPEGWVYFPLTNPTATPTEVVLSMPPFRCSRATLFTERAGPIDSVATLLNNTPLGERLFLSYLFAFPIKLAAGQTRGVLLRTDANVGYHEIDLKLTNRRVFQDDVFYDIIREGAVILCCLLIGLVALGIGFMTPSRLMISFGAMMLVIMLQFASLYGYLSPLRYPEWTSFNSVTSITVTRLLGNIPFHFFVYEFLKPVVQPIRFYKPAMWTLIAVSGGCILLHFLPPHLYPFVNVPINRIMTSLSFISMVWLGYFGLVAYWRAGIVSVGLAGLLVIGEIIVKQLTEVLLGNELSLLKLPVLNPLTLIGMLTYLAAAQFQRELVTKRQMKKQMQQAHEAINTIRRDEVDRIGRDLHDQVGNTLAAALGYLNRPETAPGKSSDLIRNAITELRFLSHNLVKDDDRPLTEKMETLVSRFNDFSAIRFVFGDYTDQRINHLPPIQQQSIYGIVQELLTNIVRHSGASEAQVQFFAQDEIMAVTVEDDGTGFDLTTAQTTGIGIQNMFKRAKLAQITLHFDPAPSGTSVHLTITPDETPSNRSN